MTLLLRLLGMVVLGLGGGEQGAAQDSEPIPALESPFAFCTRVGTEDRLGSSFSPTSGATLATIQPYLQEALGLPINVSFYPNEIFWRCMDGKVYVCARGANIPCDSKADRSSVNRGAENYCRENPNASAVPAYATGHRTVYGWRCIDGHAERGPTVIATDRRGFRTDIWHVILR